jgi:hypothetical protein
MTLLICVLLGALACDLAYAAVIPLKTHKLCGGKGTDSFCHFRGKVPRFGTRIVRPKVWREYR